MALKDWEINNREAGWTRYVRKCNHKYAIDIEQNKKMVSYIN